MVARWSSLALVALIVAGVAADVRRAEADESALAGKWKLVLLPFGEDEFLLLQVTEKDGQASANVVAAQSKLPFLKDAAVKSFEPAQDNVKLVVAAAGGETEFRGTLVKQGKEAGRVLGTFSLSGNIYPARLEKTDAEKLADLVPGPLRPKLAAAVQEQDARARVEKLEALLAETPGPSAQLIYTMMFRGLSQAEMPAAQVRQHVQAWLAGAQPYGAAWVNACRANALQLLQGQQAYAAVSLELAQDAEQALGADAPLDAQAAVLQALVSAAKLAGRAELAAAAAPRLARIEGQLDEEYHQKVPPFQPEVFAGRTTPEANRVVLLELFTGAQCPPCVAADVAFDALLKTYRHTELVALQYHLHIPGPDPLTNADSVARARYYGINSTPSPRFNGVEGSPGGGGMANAQAKYAAYRQLIDPQLTESTASQILLNVTRSGHKLLVSAGAKAPPAAKEGEQPAESKLRLRLVLAEEAIRYVGGNKLRFHHHVVRAFPGGVEGKEVVAGACQMEAEVDLNEVRATLTRYLEDYARQASFPAALPEIELSGLSVVAFLQDDSNQRVVHAVSKPAP